MVFLNDGAYASCNAGVEISTQHLEQCSTVTEVQPFLNCSTNTISEAHTAFSVLLV